MVKAELVTFANDADLARSAAGAWLDQIDTANHAGKLHCVALSGGRIAAKFFASVVEQATACALSFARVHFFWADERCVPPDDLDSNFRLAREHLLGPLRISESRIHRVRGEESPDVAARASEADLRRIVPLNQNGQPILDLILLGLGEDGHVASLFPGEPEEIAVGKAVYRAIADSPKPPPKRITLGYFTIAAAHKVTVLASGAGKEAALRASLDPAGRTPLARVLRLRDRTDRTEILTDIPVK
jgi:6-phosphogluconolactonase